jgi:UDP-glucose 4-epimerase
MGGDPSGLARVGYFGAVRTLVTGGAGFIGSNLALRLLEAGHDVAILDNLSTGRRSNLPLDAVELIEGDVRSHEQVNAAVRRAEVVFHHAAMPSITRSLDDPLTTNAVNVEGTLNVLLAARDNGVRRVVAASSSSVYGSAPGMPRKESGPVAPLAPYPVTKLAAEHYCFAAIHSYGLETVALRYFNVFGPRQDAFSEYAAAVPRFVVAMLRGERPRVFGDGTASRDFSYISDVLDATVAAATAERAVGRAINVATGANRSVNELILALNGLLGTDLAPRELPARAGDVAVSLADISVARELLSYEPRVGFEAGLERTVAWYADEEPAADRSLEPEVAG